MWYLLKSKHRQEYNVDMNLTAKGYEVYLPLALTDKRLNRSSQYTTEPLFRSYIFFKMREGLDDFHEVSKTPGVFQIVKMTPDQYGYYNPTPVPERIIHSLKQLEDDSGVHSMDNDYKQGDKIRIKAGAFHDIEAIIEAKTADDRVVVLLNILGGKKKVELKYHQIEPAA